MHSLIILWSVLFAGYVTIKKWFRDYMVAVKPELATNDSKAPDAQHFASLKNTSPQTILIGNQGLQVLG